MTPEQKAELLDMVQSKVDTAEWKLHSGYSHQATDEQLEERMADLERLQGLLAAVESL